jgi:hypothetical protein
MANESADLWDRPASSPVGGFQSGCLAHGPDENLFNFCMFIPSKNYFNAQCYTTTTLAVSIAFHK